MRRGGPMIMDAEDRKKAAVEFLGMAASGKAAEAAGRFLAPGGRHHNVYFPAGWDPLVKGMLDASRNSPGTRLDVKHVLCEGDLVAVHSHVVHKKGEKGISVVHIFRFEGERIAEMWDIGMQIPADSPNKDGPF